MRSVDCISFTHKQQFDIVMPIPTQKPCQLNCSTFTLQNSKNTFNYSFGSKLDAKTSHISDKRLQPVINTLTGIY